LDNLAWVEFSLENFEEALNLAKKAHEIDSAGTIDLMYYEVTSGHNEEAYIRAKKIAEYFKVSGELNLQASHRIGYFFWQAGHKENVKKYLDQQIKYCKESIKLKRNIAQWGAAQYDLAMSYAFLGDKVKAYQYLDEVDKLSFYPIWWISYAKHNPFFKIIINEERYQKLIKNMESKYQAEHERVRKWLEE
jgi:tetratricopeptide (TPR) repeat protein